MEKTPENNVSSNASTHNPAQNELDLGFNQIEPITPKKPVIPEQSMFDKARNMFGRKEAAESTLFSGRKEPTFGEPNLTRQVKDTVSGSISATEAKSHGEARATTAATAFSGEPAVSAGEHAVQASTAQVQREENDYSAREAETENVKTPSSDADKVVAERNMKNPENWALLQKFPPRHRRLIIAVTAALVVLLIFFWLKPASRTVEDFQAQNNVSQPIEFQPLDQNKIAETAVANANDVANMLDDATQPTVTNPEDTAAVANPETENPAQLSQTDQDVQASETMPPSAKPAERTAAVETPRAQPQRNEQQTARTAGKQQQPAAEQKQNRRANTAAGNAAASNNKVDLPSAAGTKTLTVNQGVSLMQVFRDNNLSVADVNAMTKVKGAENVLNNFKSGDKVQVFLNRQGRVSTLRLSNGATFTRQPDGSYKYTK